MEIETVSHLFWEFAHVQQFWTSVSGLLRVCDSNINITVKTITFVICHSKPITSNMHVFKYYLSNRIKILKRDSFAFFEYKWGKVLDKLNMKQLLRACGRRRILPFLFIFLKSYCCTLCEGFIHIKTITMLR